MTGAGIIEGIIGGMSRYRLKKTVVMVGMMGAGKTAVGAALAALLEVPFVDSDAQIADAANLTISELFETYGEAFFRDKETLVLSRLLAQGPSILSTGGGAFLQKRNRTMIASSGLAVWLKVERALLWARVRHKDTRPLLRVENPREKLFALLAAREPAYRQAGLIIAAKADYSVQDMAAKVLAGLLAHPSGLLQRVD